MMMSSMLKSLSILVLLTSSLFAITNKEMVKFVEGQLKKNPSVKLQSVKIRDSFELENNAGWDVFIVDMKGKVKQKVGERNFQTQDILFANDNLIAPELIDAKTGESVKGSISPEFKAEYYDDKNLVMGYKNAKHKIVLFSDPLCPFCIKAAKQLIPFIKKHPKTYALYYYHFPLLRLHPASKTVVKAMAAAMKNGKKNVLYRVYTSKFNPQETNEHKTLSNFNKALRMNLTMKEINTPAILKHIMHDKKVAAALLVNSTPTMFFDGKKDSTREKYRKVNLVD